MFVIEVLHGGDIREKCLLCTTVKCMRLRWLGRISRKKHNYPADSEASCDKDNERNVKNGIHSLASNCTS